jgi:hypothetical protein
VTTDEPVAGRTGGPGAATTSARSEVEIFNNGSLAAVANGGKAPQFATNRASSLTSVLTYHYNGGRGAPGGTIAIMGADGTIYGPWPVEVRNSVYWIARPGITLPAGRYRVVDSDPATWSQNEDSDGKGHVIIKGVWH